MLNNRNHGAARGPRNRSGSVTVEVALALPVLALASALAIDLGHLRSTKALLQTAADAAAHAAVLDLDSTADGATEALDTAVLMAQANGVWGQEIDRVGVELGTWDDETRSFEVSQPEDASAIRLTIEQDVELIGFSRLFSPRPRTIRAAAIAEYIPGDWGDSDDDGGGVESGHFDVDTSSFLSPFGPGTCRQPGECPGCDEDACEDACAGDRDCERACGDACNDRAGTDGHVHEYDNSFDRSYVDVFDIASGNLGVLSEHVDASQRFKILILNADMSREAQLIVNGDPWQATAWDDMTLDELPTYSLDGQAGTIQLNALELGFPLDAIRHGGLMPTETGCVKRNDPGDNGEWRNGALAMQVVPVNADGTDGFTTDLTRSAGGVQGGSVDNLLYEVTVFWHWSSDEELGMSGGCYGDDGYNFVPGPKRDAVAVRIVQ